MGVLEPAVMQPFSRGTVTVTSADARVHPEVQFNLLADERDRVRLRDGVRRVAALCRDDAVTRISTGAVVGSEGRPLVELVAGGGCRHRRLVGGAVGDYVHASGTCRLGRPDDPEAVVDPQCRVIGYTGLRVVDTSIFPAVPRANTHLSVVAAAELAAARWGAPPRA